MIISFFNQGKGKGGPIINYLFNEEKHSNYKPELIKGNAVLTRSIIDNTTRLHKYTTGVISFRDGEMLTEEKQLALINDFERTFAPFREEDRINFLWVRHMDKGRLELHFVTPMTDLKTNLKFNISPPGKPNQDFFKKYQAIKNYEFGFKQVEKDKPLRLNDFKQLKREVDNYVDKRIEFIIKRFDTPKKLTKIKTKGVKNGRQNVSGKFSKYANSFECFRKLSPFPRSKTSFNRTNKSANNAHPNGRARTDFKSSEGNNQNISYIKPANRAGNNGRGSQDIKGKSGDVSQAKNQVNLNGLNNQEKIRRLGMQLTTCSLEEQLGILLQIGQLREQEMQQAFPTINTNKNRPKI